MRILFLAPQPFFRERGTPLRTRNILAALTDAGHEVDLLCYPFGADEVWPGLRLFRSPRFPGIRDVKVGPSLAKVPLDGLMFLKAIGMVLRRRYDVIQAVEEAGFFGLWLARLFRAALVYDMDSYISEQLIFSGFAPRGPLLWLARRLERAAMRGAAGVVTVGSAHTAEVRRLAPKTRVVQLEDAPPQDRFEPDEAGAARLRAELGLGAAPVVVYTGNFEEYQGVEILMSAAGTLARTLPAARIVLAGGEPDQIKAMKGLAESAGAGGMCVFAGRRPPAEMPAFFTLASALVTPRHRGANPPMKIYLYMQSGRPVVATRVPTHLQALDDTVAFLVEPDPESLAEGLRRALTDSAGAVARAAAAARRVEERYSRPIFQAKVRGLMDAIAAERA